MNKFNLTAVDFQTQLTKKMLIELFVDRQENGQTIPKQYDVNEVFSVKLLDGKTLTTTVGRFIFNSFVLPKQFFSSEFYINEQITKKQFNNLFDKLSEKVLNGELLNSELSDVTDRITWIGSQFVNTVGDSYGSDSLTLSEESKNKITKLVEEIDPDDTVSLDANEKEIVKILKDDLSDKSIGRIIASGAKGSWDGNAKPTLAVRGLINDEYSKDNLTEGNSLDSYTKINSLHGSYSRSAKTALGGYQVNLINAGLNHTSLDTKTSDCRTTGYLIIKIDEANFKKFKLRRVKLLRDTKDRFKKWTILNDDNKKEFFGKEIAIRSVMFCRNKNGYCTTCYGASYTQNGITKNLGSLTALVGSNTMNKSMKAFHSSSLKRDTIDFTKIEIK